MQVNSIVEEYFSSGDVNNAADSLTDLDAPVAFMGHYFVKRLLTLALDRKDKEREMASNLLSNLYSEVGAGQLVHSSPRRGGCNEWSVFGSGGIRHAEVASNPLCSCLPSKWGWWG
jgi:hypothetical protein